MPAGNFARMVIIRRLPAVAAMALALAACSDSAPLSPAAHTTVQQPLPAAAHYILLGPTGPVSSALKAAVTAAGGRILRSHAGTGLVLVAGLSPKAAAALRGTAGVTMVVADKVRPFLHGPIAMQRVSAPFRARSGRSSTVRGNPDSAYFLPSQWNMAVTGADTAWASTTQGAGSVVYILDTGVDTNHIDLKGKVSQSLSTSFAYAPTDTDEVNPLPFWHDTVGHGTFVSSLITSNSLGVAAVAPAATLVMVRVLDDDGSGSDFSIISGILYAADAGATIVNASLGGYLSRTDPDDLDLADFYQRVADYAAAKGVLFVVASGNEGVNTNTGVSTSGSYLDSLEVPGGLRNTISVGATGPVDSLNFDTITSYSNFGKAGVGMFAPGGTVDGVDYDLVTGACSSYSGICPAGQENYYAIGAGTSFASPMVAGAAAVLEAQSANTAPAAIKGCLFSSAHEPTGTRPDVNYNNGRLAVNAASKVSACQ